MAEQISGFPELVDHRFLGGDEGAATFYNLELRKGPAGWLVVIAWERQGLFRDGKGWSHPKTFKTAAEAKRYFAGDSWRRQIRMTHDRSGTGRR